MWELNICGNFYPSPSLAGFQQIGNAFINAAGYYVEVIEEWNATGFDPTQGKPGAYSQSNEAYNNSGFLGHGVEVDNIDATGLEQAMIEWNGGSGHLFANTGTPPSYPTIENGNAYGVLIQAPTATWYKNNTSWGTVNFDIIGEAAYLLSSHQCWGLMATSQFPTTVDSVRAWRP